MPAKTACSLKRRLIRDKNFTKKKDKNKKLGRKSKLAINEKVFLEDEKRLDKETGPKVRQNKCRALFFGV